MSSEIQRRSEKRIKEHGSWLKNQRVWPKGYCSLPGRVSETEEWILHSRMDARWARETNGGEGNEKEKERKKGRERGKNRGERSFQTNRGSIHPRYTAPRCRARVKQCARPFTEWKHGPAMRETWTEMRVALQRATASPANCFSLTGPKSGEIPRTCIT